MGDREEVAGVGEAVALGVVGTDAIVVGEADGDGVGEASALY